MISTPEIPVSLGAAYTDVQGLKSLPTDSQAALRKAAGEFESMFLDIWLKSMRDANAVFSEGSYLSSSAVEMHQEMLDHQYAVHMSEAGGIGLGDVLVKQLSGRDVDPDGVLDTRVPARTPMSARTGSAATDASQANVTDSANGPTYGAAATARLNPQGSARPLFESAQAFVDELMPVVEKLLEDMPINPINVVAQAALETGWGQKVIHDQHGQPSFNLFGIKAEGWSGDKVEVTTLEHEFGRMSPRKASFRSYEDLSGSVGDYLRLLGSRYRDAMGSGKDAFSFGSALQKAGYATDPAYGRKIEAVAERVRSLLGSIETRMM
ncbi:MAG: flagellar assembly peptidoglycan hydrolase FlgJ [Pseudomonadales bacterium]|nr:flagellar assembly peptidoglycan hydrolase FlgJ [Pseudomonadales bacterium]